MIRIHNKRMAAFTAALTAAIFAVAVIEWPSGLAFVAFLGGVTGMATTVAYARIESETKKSPNGGHWSK